MGKCNFGPTYETWMGLLVGSIDALEADVAAKKNQELMGMAHNLAHNFHLTKNLRRLGG